MIIRCERCSTTFQLDDALVPPGGASVQCSRCQHEFWATREGEERRLVLSCPRCVTRFWLSESAVPVEGADVQCSRCRTVFRADRRPATPPADPPSAPGSANAAPGPLRRSNVMLFGSAFSSEALPDPTQPPAESYRSAQGRVVIGAPPLPPPNVPGNRVMVFGAPAPVPAPRAPQPEFVPRLPTEAERILDRVAGDLENEQALLVASDALMELGDARGRLIAFMLEEERQTDLMRKVKVNVLIRDHAKEWAPPGARFISYRRGLPIEVEWNGPSDPAHHAWRSARSINATLERVPRPSVFDVARPRLTRFTCVSREVFAHVVAVAPKNLEVLDGHIDRDQLLEGLVSSLAKLSKLRIVTLRSTTQQFDAGLAPIHLRAFLTAASRLPSLKLVRFSMPRLPPAELGACLAVAPALTVQFVMPWYGAEEKLCTLGIDTQRMQILVPEGVPTDLLLFELREQLVAQLGGPLSIVRSD